MTTHVYFFPPLRPPPGEATAHTGVLERAMAVDAAERLAADGGFVVTVFEPPGGATEPGDAGKGVHSRTMQDGVPAGRCIREAVHSFHERKEGENLVVILSTNPLYPPSEIWRAVMLLSQEDEAVVYAATGVDEEAPVVLTATRNFHPELYGFPDFESRPPTLREVVAAEALVVPLRPVRAIAAATDFSWLLHEVERELLLGHWHPPRTFAVLKSMRRNNVIPEPA